MPVKPPAKMIDPSPVNSISRIDTAASPGRWSAQTKFPARFQAHEKRFGRGLAVGHLCTLRPDRDRCFPCKATADIDVPLRIRDNGKRRAMTLSFRRIARAHTKSPFVLYLSTTKLVSCTAYFLTKVWPGPASTSIGGRLARRKIARRQADCRSRLQRRNGSKSIGRQVRTHCSWPALIEFCHVNPIVGAASVEVRFTTPGPGSTSNVPRKSPTMYTF